MSEMHLLNLKNTSLVSQGRRKLADVLRSSANGLVDRCIHNHPESIAEYIRHVQCIGAAEANQGYAITVNATADAAPVTSVYKEE